MVIKYINLNIWMGEVFENTLKFLKEQNADIVVLQEVMHHENSEEFSIKHQTKVILERELGLRYSEYFPLVLDKRFNPPALFGNLILSRFPIENSKKVFFDRPFREWDNSLPNEEFTRGLLVCEINVNNTLLTVGNIHGIWGKHGADTDRRLNMIDTVLKELKGKERVILSGDFNLNERVYREINGKADLSKPQRTKSVALLEEKFVNIFKDERITSFNPNYKDFATTGYAHAVVDMVFVSPNIKILSHVQPDIEVSDHMPQIVELEIN
jgi:endonuclease/exonuclease/phosphatase family metal-dependent hydrolase